MARGRPERDDADASAAETLTSRSEGAGGRATHRGGAHARLYLVPEDSFTGEDSYGGWESIYRDNVHRVYRLMFAKVGNRHDAEDLTTEVFLAALRPLRTTASVGEVRAYLTVTARTVLAAYWRRTLGHPVTTLDEDVADEPLREPPTASETLRQVEAILEELPERQRRILQLRFLGACSIKEAAAELGITVSNAKVLQHRALRKAAEVAERMGG